MQTSKSVKKIQHHNYSHNFHEKGKRKRVIETLTGITLLIKFIHICKTKTKNTQNKNKIKFKVECEKIEKKKRPVVRALIMPALRPLKSRKTSSTVRGL